MVFRIHHLNCKECKLQLQPKRILEPKSVYTDYSVINEVTCVEAYLPVYMKLFEQQLHNTQKNWRGYQFIAYLYAARTQNKFAKFSDKNYLL